MIKRFIIRLTDFIRRNIWVMIVYLFIMTSFFTLPGNENRNWTFLHAVITSSMHLIGDIFMMMMMDDYKAKKRDSGSKLQVIAAVIFTSAKIYSAIMENAWQYLISDPAFIISAIKGYRIDIINKHFFIDKTWKFICICLCCFLIFFFVATFRKSNNFVDALFLLSPSDYLNFIQVIGLLIFATGLYIRSPEHLSDIVCVVGLSVVVVLSGISVLRMFVDCKKPAGLDISHFLLPLVVLIYKLRTLTKVTVSYKA